MRSGKLASAVAAFIGIGSAGWISGAVAQTFNEFPIPTANAFPVSFAFGPDGNLWFTERDANQIAKITSTGAITEFPLPPNSAGQSRQPLIITAAPDGALYFTLANASQIGRITTDGSVTFCNTPTRASGPNGIAVGADGNIWFTEIAVSKIGVLVTGSCTITEFPTPTANSRPARIALGPDGNLWFTESQTSPAVNQIGRITLQGAIAEFPVTTAASEPFAIRPFYDGNIWFTERGASQIGVMNISGQMVREIPTPTLNSDPVGLSFGPDGNLWFTERTANKLARIGDNNSITDLPIPTAGGEPGALITGPDGALWFTEQAGNKIGRFEPISSSIQLYAAVLPSSRSPQVGEPATVFASIVNAGPGTATGCRPKPVSFLPVSVAYQTTNPVTNQLTGTLNTPADIPAGGSQSFVFSTTPNAAFVPLTLRLGFACANANAAPIVPGVDTELLSASTSPVPDVIAIAETESHNGVLQLPSSTGSNAFAVATFNLGATASITLTLDTGGASLPLTLTVCRTNSQANCLTPPAPSVTTTIPTNGTPTFSVFATASGPIPFIPQTNRVFVEFRDQTGAVRGSTSVAVQTLGSSNLAAQ